MKVISMVPSWTETLFVCGADLVGRTRFCIHPKTDAADVTRLQTVGGTKDIDWEKVKTLEPDLLILDREENPKSMSEPALCEVLDTHVTKVEDVPRELERMADRFEQGGDPHVAGGLKALAARWHRVLAVEPAPLSSWDSFPGAIEWIKKPVGFPDVTSDQCVAYVIWKNPWMLASRETFIGSMIERIGLSKKRVWSGNSSESKYPEFLLESLPSSVVLLYSSEPYPFHKKKKDLVSMDGPPGVIVDGESFSWFGVRSLQFLERKMVRDGHTV